MLDDPSYINDHDPSDALGTVAGQWRQLNQKFEVPMLSTPKQVVFVGMGGSALGASLTKTWPGYNIPFEIVRDYHLPSYTNQETLVVLASYSGNTEEVISAFQSAIKLTSNLVVITCGGQLKELAQQAKVGIIELTQETQPRYATLALFKALVTIMQSIGQIKPAEAETIIKQSAKFIKQEITNWTPEVVGVDNLAKQLAQAVIGKTPVIYAGNVLAPAAYKWKISFNENAKNVAWWGQYPEFNHNEFIGWSSHPIEKPYTIIDLRSNFEAERVIKRFDLSDRLLSGRRPKAHVVEAKGETVLDQLLWTTVLGDFVSIYTAILNGVNPTPVDLVEKLKAELKKS